MIALSVVGLALVGVATPASATPDAARQANELCVSLEPPDSPSDEVRDCGRRVRVDLDDPATEIGLKYGDRLTCVILRTDADCAQGWAKAGSEDGFTEVLLYVRNTYYCGQARAGIDANPVRCSNRRGWLRLTARGDIDSISLWIPRRQPRF